MADYFGIGEIARRLNIAPNTVLAWHQDRGFIMYWRRKGQSFRACWYTNDALITTWEIAQAALHRGTKGAAADRRRNLSKPPASNAPARSDTERSAHA